MPFNNVALLNRIRSLSGGREQSLNSLLQTCKLTAEAFRFAALRCLTNNCGRRALSISICNSCWCCSDAFPSVVENCICSLFGALLSAIA